MVKKLDKHRSPRTLPHLHICLDLAFRFSASSEQSEFVMADSKRKRGGKGNATGGAKKDDSARFAADDARWGRQGGKGEGRGGKVRLDARFADLFTNPDFAETCTLSISLALLQLIFAIFIYVLHFLFMSK